MIQLVQKVVAPLWRRVLLMVARGIVTAVSEGDHFQSVSIKVLTGEKHDVTRLQEYGRATLPLPGAQSAQVYMGGLRNHGLIVAIDDPRYRPVTLLPGEVIDFTDEGVIIHHKRGRMTEMTCDTLVIKADTGIVFDTPLLTVTGDVIDQTGAGNENSMALMRSIYDGHAHHEHDGPTTSAPLQQE